MNDYGIVIGHAYLDGRGREPKSPHVDANKAGGHVSKLKTSSRIRPRPGTGLVDFYFGIADWTQCLIGYATRY